MLQGWLWRPSSLSDPWSWMWVRWRWVGGGTMSGRLRWEARFRRWTARRGCTPDRTSWSRSPHSRCKMRGSRCRWNWWNCRWCIGPAPAVDSSPPRTFGFSSSLFGKIDLLYWANNVNNIYLPSPTISGTSKRFFMIFGKAHPRSIPS